MDGRAGAGCRVIGENSTKEREKKGEDEGQEEEGYVD